MSQFKYQPQWQGPLSGRSFEKQTEDAINALMLKVQELSDDLASITGYASFARLSYEDVNASQNIQADEQNAMQILVCTGTITLALLAANSNTSWILVKNGGTGVVTIQPAGPQITIDGLSQTVTLQPGEYYQLIGQTAGAYITINDGRWPTAIDDAVSTAIGNFQYMG